MNYGKEIFKLLDINKNYGKQVIIKRIKENIFYVMYDEKEYIVKFVSQPFKKNLVRHVVRKIIGNITFDNELNFYTARYVSTTNKVNYPFLVKYKRDAFAIQYIPNIQISNTEVFQQYMERVVDGIYEFNAKNSVEYRNLMMRFVAWLYFSPFNIAIRSLGTVLRKIGVVYALKVGFLMVKCNIRQKKLYNKIMHHNDLEKSHIVVERPTGKLYILDFGSVYYGRKWFFIDIIYYLSRVNRTILPEDYGVISRYIKLLENNTDFKRINIPVQIRFAILFHTLASLKRKAGSDAVKKILDDILLYDEKYLQWFHEKFGNHLYEKIRLESSR